MISFSFPHFGLLKPGGTVVRRPELSFFVFFLHFYCRSPGIFRPLERGFDPDAGLSAESLQC